MKRIYSIKEYIRLSICFKLINYLIRFQLGLTKPGGKSPPPEIISNCSSFSSTSSTTIGFIGALFKGAELSVDGFPPTGVFEFLGSFVNSMIYVVLFNKSTLSKKVRCKIRVIFYGKTDNYTDKIYFAVGMNMIKIKIPNVMFN